ncbi:MAG: hypothetical protein PHH68_04730 [Candidatus Omnitrophica bacterium]|nr:hypothetical protein [Candidatus Omnitrophota bacterium]
MTRSKVFLRNSAKLGLNICVFIFACLGCSASLVPTYSKSEVEKAITGILSVEYKDDAVAKLAGSTLWVYLPMEDIFEKAEKPEKNLEKFIIEKNTARFLGDQVHCAYRIKAIPERQTSQEYVFSKKAREKMSNAIQVLRRVILSIDRGERNEIKFFILAASDINNGMELTETIYAPDLLKVSYGAISPGEYQHRISINYGVNPGAVGDKDGRHLEYKDLTLREFISRQIIQRIALKFQKPEVEQSADVDKEVARIIGDTLRIYRVRNVSRAWLDNLFTKSRVELTHSQIYNKRD